MAGEGGLQFRGAGGIYKIAAIAPSGNEYKLIANWLYTAISTALGHTRVYNTEVPEGVGLAEGTRVVTYAWDHSDPDSYTYGHGGTRVRVSVQYWQVMSWIQGKTYSGVDADAATLVGALDVRETVTADGTIAGAERERFHAAAVQET